MTALLAAVAWKTAPIWAPSLAAAVAFAWYERRCEAARAREERE